VTRFHRNKLKYLSGRLVGSPPEDSRNFANGTLNMAEWRVNPQLTGIAGQWKMTLMKRVVVKTRWKALAAIIV